MLRDTVYSRLIDKSFSMKKSMKKNDILLWIRIEKLVYGGSWMATLPEGMKVFITGWAIPESIVDLRVLRVKQHYAETQILRVVSPSPLEQTIPEHWQVYGWCKWLSIPYEKQCSIKEEQVHEAFHLLDHTFRWTVWHAIIPSPQTIWYRNKLEFSWGKYISEREWVHDEFRFGFHLPGQFDRIENCRYCILADEEINAIFRDIDIFARSSWQSTYDPKTGRGLYRHLVVRKTRQWEVMIIWSMNTHSPEWDGDARDFFLAYNRELRERFPALRSVYLLENTGRADIVTGRPVLLLGVSSITEKLLGKKFAIQPLSFFQTNSLWAEKLYSVVESFCGEASDTLLDLYAGTGTIGIILASRFKKVYSVESVTSATRDAVENAHLNTVNNIECINAKTEDFLKGFLDTGKTASVIVVDPPRDWLHPHACRDILRFHAETIIYVSCNPATLVRDLGIILEAGEYSITDIAPVDMFPHTHHIETVVKLVRRNGGSH